MSTASRTPLTIRSLMACLGVSHMTVLAWSRGIPRYDCDPMPRKPAALARWAKKHGVPLVGDPQKFAERPATATQAAKRRRPSARAAKRSRPH